MQQARTVVGDLERKIQLQTEGLAALRAKLKDVKRKQRAMKSNTPKELVLRLGGPAAVARARGISRQAVAQWRVIPDEHVAWVAKQLGISKGDVRPDLY